MRMMTMMAVRNAMRQPRRSFLLGGAVAFGVLVMSLAAGFTSGMERAVQDNVTLLSGGHVIVSGYTGSASGRAQNRSADEALAELLEKAGGKEASILSVLPQATAQANVVFGSIEQQIRLRGVVWERDALYRRNIVLQSGVFPSGGADRSMVLGAKAASRFGLALGDQVLVRLGTASGQQNVVEYQVGAIYEDSAAGALMTAFVPFGQLRQDLNLPEGNWQNLAVTLADASRAEAGAARLRAAMQAAGYRLAGSGGRAQGQMPQSGQMAQSGQAGLAAGEAAYRIATVTEMAGQAGAVLGTVRWIGYAIFAVMLALTAAGISNTYRMVLAERTREIGTLRCIGFRRTHVFRLFLIEAVIVSVAGALAGMAMSFPIGWLAELVTFDSGGTLGTALAAGHLRFDPEFPQLAAAFFAVVGMAAIAVSGSARRAARMRPAQALAKTA